MTQLVGPLSSGVAVGGENVAVANRDSGAEIIGRLSAVYVKYTLSYGGDDIDLDITTKGGNGHPPAQTILSLQNAGTDGWFYPRTAICQTNGSTIANLYEELSIYDIVNVAIADAYPGDAVDVWLLLD